MMPDIPAWIALPATVLLIVGGLLTLVGSIGLLRLPNFSCASTVFPWATRSAWAVCCWRRC